MRKKMNKEEIIQSVKNSVDLFIKTYFKSVVEVDPGACSVCSELTLFCMADIEDENDLQHRISVARRDIMKILMDYVTDFAPIHGEMPKKLMGFPTAQNTP
jgi:hypothetical protein